MEIVAIQSTVSSPSFPPLARIKQTPTRRPASRKVPRAELGGRLKSSGIIYTFAPAEPPAPRSVSPLVKGGSLSKREAAGKGAPNSPLRASNVVLAAGAKFSDPRWKNGTWDLTQFSKDGNVDWDAVIDAEVTRRKWLEETSQSSLSDVKVVVDTTVIPWWARVRRFHLPEAEKLNGRAAMVGFVSAYVVDAATGVGLIDQMAGLMGKLFLLLTVAGVLLVRSNTDIERFKSQLEESGFFD